MAMIVGLCVCLCLYISDMQYLFLFVVFGFYFYTIYTCICMDGCFAFAKKCFFDIVYDTSLKLLKIFYLYSLKNVFPNVGLAISHQAVSKRKLKRFTAQTYGSWHYCLWHKTLNNKKFKLNRSDCYKQNNRLVHMVNE